MQIRNSLLILLFFWPLSVVASNKTIQFEKKTIQLGRQKILVEIADTPEKSAQGLMFRRKLEDGAGMLFIFDREAPRSFWMKNTFIPLDIGYFNSKKELIDIQTMEPVTSELQINVPTYPSKGPAQYALEVPKGWFTRHKIRLKERFSFK